MNKLDVINEIGALADRFAFLLEHYTESHDGYDGRTEDDEPIIVGQISVSIQNGELATIGAGIGCIDSKYRIEIKRHPNSNNTEWRIEDK